MIEIDEIAKELAIRYGMPPDLHVPIAARNKEAISKYIGTLSQISANSINTFLVTPYYSSEPNRKLPIWEAKGVEILHSPRQV